MKALSQCLDSNRLKSCLWPEVLEGTLVLRPFGTQLYTDLETYMQWYPNRIEYLFCFFLLFL